MPRAPSSVGGYISTRVDEGRKCLPVIKVKARNVVGRGEEDPLCEPGSELLVGGRTRVQAVQG